MTLPITPTVTPIQAIPGAVTKLTAIVSGTTVSLKWTNPASAVGNRIYLNGILLTTVAPEATPFTVTNAPSGWHTYNVSAYNANGEGPQSASETNFVTHQNT